MTIPPLFQGFPKMSRLSRECIITEKIDGTNAQILITEDNEIFCGSRTQWITPQNDNYGFAAWVEVHKEELLQLGVGRHFGEWWGQGIQRKYGMKEKRFSLFNTIRWCNHIDTPQPITTSDPRIIKMQDVLPSCCSVVPVLYRGEFCTDKIECVLSALERLGSRAAQGFMDPEGIVIFHVAGNVGFKKTLKDDGVPKSKVVLTVS